MILLWLKSPSTFAPHAIEKAIEQHGENYYCNSLSAFRPGIS
jgi:hypothetical protein